MVQMQIIVDQRRFSVAQVGPDFLVLNEPLNLPPTRAELVVRIDDTEKRRTIFFPDGVRASDERTRIASAS
jgi:hypothetical protein